MKHLRLIQLFCTVLLCAAAMQAAAMADPKGQTTHLEGEAKQLADWLIEGMRSGWEQQQFQTYRAMWSLKAERTWARSLEPGEHDWSTTADVFLRSDKIFVDGKDAGEKLKFQDISVKIEHRQATVEWQLWISTDVSDYRELIGQRMVLQRSDHDENGWKIVKDRFWVVEAIVDEERVVFTEEEWAQRDREVIEAKASGDPRFLAGAFNRAYRFKEAYQTVVKVTQHDDAEAMDWSMRGYIASIAAEPGDVYPSFDRAMEMDAGVWVPHYAVPHHPETEHLEGTAKHIADTVITAQRAGWENHDLERYMAPWADEATLTWGRSDQPGKYDQPIDLDTIRATRAIRMRGMPPNDRYVYDDVKVQIDGRSAKLSLTVEITAEDDAYQNRTSEQYELIQTKAGWRVTKNRAWPISIRTDEGKTIYNEQQWAALDAAALQAQRAGTDTAHAYTLLGAYRFDEAYEAAVRGTMQKGASAEHWGLRGFLAALAGQPEDVDPSFEKARSIDPEVWLPAFAIPQDTPPKP